MKKFILYLLIITIPIFMFGYGASWNQNLEDVIVNPRINIVHVDSTNDNTFYNFLSSIPMTYFHDAGNVYASYLTTDNTEDTTIGYLLDDWADYLDSHGSFERHANYIGSVDPSIISSINSKFNITAGENYDTIKGTPDEISVKIAKKDWSNSSYIVIAPYITPIDTNILISIANAAAIASMHNAPVIYTIPDSLSDEAKNTIASLNADSAIIVDIGSNLSSTVNTQLTGIGISNITSLNTINLIVTYVRNIAGRSNLCGIVNKNQILPAALEAARYNAYVLYLPNNIQKAANDLKKKILADRDLQSFYKLTESIPRKDYITRDENQIATNFYTWLESIGGNDPNYLETVITFEPQGTGNGILETTFERAISGDPSNLTRKGAVTGRMPLNWERNIALANRTIMYTSIIFANPRPTHITETMNAYEIQHAVDQGSPIPDSWGTNHIINEIFGWPAAGWTTANGNFPWDDIHSNPPILSPILPPGPGDGAGYDCGQFASFLKKSYDVVFHSGANTGSGQHPSQPTVDNIGFIQDVNDGSAFLYFSCHGGGTSIAIRNIDNGVAQDASGEAWGADYWPDDDGRTYDGSAGGSYTQSDLNNDLTNAHSMMIAYNACGMANGYMNEVLLVHGGAMSIGSYTSVSFTGSGWWWNVWVHLVTNEGYTVGEAAMYATARVANLYVPADASDGTLQYVIYGDPNTPFVQTDWTNPNPAPIKEDYNGHIPDKPANITTGTTVPDSIQVLINTSVTVTMQDSFGNPLDTAFVTISSYGVNLSDSTNTSGQAIFSITAPYGELLKVTGTCHNFATYIDTITVTDAGNLTGINITASCPSVGLTDTLAVGLAGTISTTVNEANYNVKLLGCGIDTTFTVTGNTGNIDITPVSTGNIEVILLKSGYNIYKELIPVVEAYGTLSGIITDTLANTIPGVSIKGYPYGSDTSIASTTFDVLSDTSGYYSVPDSILCGKYDIYLMKFGYISKHDTTTILYGVNVLDIQMEHAPSGILYGIVTDTLGTPLNADISIYRSDDLSLYTQTISDSSLGGVYSVTLPYFNYQIRVKAPHYKLQTQDIIIDNDSLNIDFQLVPQSGFLVIKDGGTKAYDNKWFGKELKRIDTRAANSKSADSIASYLTDMGYDIVSEDASTTVPATWSDYEIVIWSAGNNTSPLSDATWRQNLIDYVTSGGKLIIEGGEVAYDMINSIEDSAFYNNVLHANDWDTDNAGNLTIASGMETLPLVTTPNNLPAGINITYGSFGDNDAAKPTSDASIVYFPGTYTADGGIIIYDDTPDLASCQIIDYLFNLTAISDQNIAKQLLQNSVEYLTAEESTPTASISGTISCSDAGDPLGAIITISVGGFEDTDTVGSSGNYAFGPLYAATYGFAVSKDNYCTIDTSIALSEGQILTDVDFILIPSTETTFVSEDTPIDIPDNNSTGIWSIINVGDNRIITDIRVYVNITHTWIGDLTVTIMAPGSDSVVLHNRTGSSSDDIIGWYPTELTVDGPGALTDFLDQDAIGDWKLHIADHVSGDAGTLNEWQLCIQSPQGIAKIFKTSAPMKFDIRLAYMNDKKNRMSVEFAIPEHMSGKDLKASIIDVSGRVVQNIDFGEMHSGYVKRTIDVSGLKNGVFFIMVNIDKKAVSNKFIVIK